MRIAIVSGDDLNGEDCGQFAAALGAQGLDVTAYIRQSGRRRPRKGANQDYRLIPVCVGADAARSDRDMLPFVGEWATLLERSWSSRQPDIVHAQGWLGGLAAQLAARRQHLPVVQTFRGLAAISHPPSADDPDDHVERASIEPLLARSATWVTGESTADVDTLAKLRRSRKGLSVLVGGVDVERYSPVGAALNRTDLHRIVCVAPNPQSYNGFDTVIRAMPRVPDTELVIAETADTDHRNDDARAGLKHFAAELGVADRVHFLGTVVGNQLPKLLRSADMVACTPRRAPRPTTVLQAMASGVAVVAAPVGVLEDVVVHGVTGIVLPAGSPDELATVLRSVPAQSFRCQSMGAAGRSRVLSRFTWDRVALESLAIYRQLTSLSLRSDGASVVAAGATQ